MFGLLGVIFGILGFFTFGLIFIPLGLLCTVISLASKRGFLLGIISLIMNVVAISASPSVWLVIASLSNQYESETGQHLAPLETAVDSNKKVDSSNPYSEMGTPATVIRAFYDELSAGNGNEAVKYLSDDMRAKKNFQSDAISKFYGSFSQPLSITGIFPTKDGAYNVYYSYKFSNKVCDGNSTVYTITEGNRSRATSLKISVAK